MKATEVIENVEAIHKWTIFEKKAFDEWTSGEDNQQILTRLKKNLLFALKNEISNKQRTYLLAYYMRGMNVHEIAKKYCVNPSTVSRSINRARKNLLHVLRYTDPSLLNCTRLPALSGKMKLDGDENNGGEQSAQQKGLLPGDRQGGGAAEHVLAAPVRRSDREG